MHVFPIFHFVEYQTVMKNGYNKLSTRPICRKTVLPFKIGREILFNLKESLKLPVKSNRCNNHLLKVHVLFVPGNCQSPGTGCGVTCKSAVYVLFSFYSLNQ